MNQVEQASSSAKRTPRVSAACISCRNKHIRCDATRPNCSRCLSDGNQCQYVKSRRGGLSKTQLQARQNGSVTGTQPSAPESISRPMASHELYSIEPTQLPEVLHENHHSSQLGVENETLLDDSPEVQRQAETISIAKCTYLDLYYKYFHKCHPCVLPRRQLQKQYECPAKRKRLEPLVSVMRYIGSLFTGSNISFQLNELAMRAISEVRNGPLDPFMAQCHLLYCIALFWCGEKNQSGEHLDAAVRTAIGLGMFHQKFAVENGEGDECLGESWRRTWWQVYIADCIFAAIRRETMFLSRDVDVAAELPCGDCEYEAGVIPTPKTLDDFDNREFAFENHVYSSFAYLIGATRCTVSAAAVVPPDMSSWDSSKILAEADAIFDGWHLLLPDSKREVLGTDGQVDELMFQAQMLLKTTTILFHRPFSKLFFNPLESISTCSNGLPPDVPAQESMIVHTTRCLQAIEGEVRLLALPTPPLQHSPFTVCMINESAIPLLSACKFLFTGQKLSVARSQLRLMIGSLKSLAKAWPRAVVNMQELQAIAREVLAKNPQENAVSSRDIPQYADGAGSSRVWDPSLLEDMGDLAIPSASMASLDALWVADVQTEMPRWFENSDQWI